MGTQRKGEYRMRMNLQLFGGRGASSGKGSGGGWKLPKNAMDESDYLASKGLKDASSGWVLDKLRGNRQVATVRGRQRFNKEAEKAEKEYQDKRNKAKEEYKKLVDSGKLRPKTTIERTIEKAHGNPDNQSTQSARRMALKRGYDWKTGKKLK